MRNDECGIKKLRKGVLRKQGTFFHWNVNIPIHSGLNRRIFDKFIYFSSKKSIFIIMKKFSLLIAVLFGAVYCASAQYYNTAPAAKFGIGVSSGFATGAVSGVFPQSGGISLNMELPINKSPLSFMVTTGYTFYVSGGGYYVDYYGYGYDASTYSNGDVASFIPVEAGLKLRFAHRLFIEGYGGVSFNVNAYPSDYTGKANDFIYSTGAGYTFPMDYNGRSNLDLSLIYENRPEPGGGYSQVALKAVWNFKL